MPDGSLLFQVGSVRLEALNRPLAGKIQSVTDLNASLHRNSAYNLALISILSPIRPQACAPPSMNNVESR